MADPTAKRRRRVWLFDLDNTLHDASHAAFGWTNQAMNEYIIAHLGMSQDEAARLRQRYLKDYGATLLGLVRHHGVDAAHFLEQTHVHPELDRLARTSTHDRAALKKLAGRRYVLTNAPRAYALRVMRILKLDRCIAGVISIEDMTMFGHLRPKPDARMFRHIAARLRVRPADCVLVEDTLEHQKAARGVGMTTAWMQRYLEGRFGGSIRDAFNARANRGFKRLEVGVHRCRRPTYVCAKIKSLQKLRTLS
ncbi:MAG TPA: HAD-IA family hydrolase [Burkholderiaceae bacterium]|nr:HAD-IA family hydrolase [Burkholderiaceae bacterium]